MSAESGTPTKPKRLPTKRDAADRLGVHVKTIENYVKSGTLRKITLSPRAVRIDPDSLERLATGAAVEVT